MLFVFSDITFLILFNTKWLNITNGAGEILFTNIGINSSYKFSTEQNKCGNCNTWWLYYKFMRSLLSSLRRPSWKWSHRGNTINAGLSSWATWVERWHTHERAPRFLTLQRYCERWTQRFWWTQTRQQLLWPLLQFSKRRFSDVPLWFVDRIIWHLSTYDKKL